VYTVRVIDNEPGLRALEEAWTRLLLCAPEATIFASHQWTAAWWRWYGSGSDLLVLAVDHATDGLVGVAPLLVRRRGPLRRLELIGAGLGDVGDVVLHPGHTSAAMAVLCAALRARRASWDLGDWWELPPGSAPLSQVRDGSLHGLRAAAFPQTPGFLIDLPTTWEGYVRSLASKRRYYVASYPQRFLRERDGTTAVIGDAAQVPTAVATFHALHLARWSTRLDELDADHRSGAFAPFLTDLCARCAERGWLQIVQLSAGGQAVASSINFLLRDRWHCYMKGFDPGWGRARPGTVLDALRIQSAIAAGAGRLDFGRGAEEYKSGFGVAPYRTTRLLLGSGTPRSRVAFGLLRHRLARRSAR
jgi:CelD/BcsL family acetyltransferase involved in cellulose biosynthesis